MTWMIPKVLGCAPVLDLDPLRAENAVPPRAAATVLVLRDDGGPLRVYVIVRHPKSAFMGGVLAFPGGKVDKHDEDPSWEDLSTPPSERLAEAAGGGETPLPASPRALAVAACRECLEEAALLPTEGNALHGAGPAELRAAVEAGKLLREELTRRSWKLDLAALRPFARWVTPTAEARRFDAMFFLLVRPEGQEGDHDPHETTGGEWATPRALIDRFERGELMLAPPTLRSLELLLPCGSVVEALALAERQSLRPVRPALASDGAVPLLVLPGDPLHPERVAVVAGPTRFALRHGRFVSEDAPVG